MCDEQLSSDEGAREVRISGIQENESEDCA
jgi:hypothetical protein